MFQIDVTSAGELLLYLPGGRTLEITATPGGLNYICKVIRDHHENIRGQRGYIGTLPTQHAVDKAFADKFIAEKRKLAVEERVRENKCKAEKLNVDWDRLEINL